MATNQKIIARRKGKMDAVMKRWDSYLKKGRIIRANFDLLCQFVGRPVSMGKGHSRRGDQVLENRMERRRDRVTLKQEVRQ